MINLRLGTNELKQASDLFKTVLLSEGFAKTRAKEALIDRSVSKTDLKRRADESYEATVRKISTESALMFASGPDGNFTVYPIYNQLVDFLNNEPSLRTTYRNRFESALRTLQQ